MDQYLMVRGMALLVGCLDGEKSPRPDPFRIEIDGGEEI